MKHVNCIKCLRFSLLILLTASAISLAVRGQIRAAGSEPVILGAAPRPVGVILKQSDMPMIALALVGPPQIGAATTTNLFAQVAIGGGYTTVFSFLNTGADATTGNLILTGDQGAPLTAAFSSPDVPGATASSFPISVPSGGSQIITAGAVNPATDGLSAGWARVESSGGALGGVSTFQLVANGTLQTIVGVLSANATNAATIPLDDDHTVNRDTGYAVANAGTTDINIKIVLVNPDGSIAQTYSPPALNPLRAGNHVATFVWQDLNNLSFQFKGSMVLIEQASQPFSVLALVLNDGLFTAIPVIPGKGPGIN